MLSHRQCGPITKPSTVLYNMNPFSTIHNYTLEYPSRMKAEEPEQRKTSIASDRWANSLRRRDPELQPTLPAISRGRSSNPLENSCRKSKSMERLSRSTKNTNKSHHNATLPLRNNVKRIIQDYHALCSEDVPQDEKVKEFFFLILN